MDMIIDLILKWSELKIVKTKLYNSFWYKYSIFCHERHSSRSFGSSVLKCTKFLRSVFVGEITIILHSNKWWLFTYIKMFCILNNTCCEDFSVYGDVHMLIGGDTTHHARAHTHTDTHRNHCHTRQYLGVRSKVFFFFLLFIFSFLFVSTVFDVRKYFCIHTGFLRQQAGVYQSLRCLD